MKKIALSLMASLASISTFALPVGNPADASLLTQGVYMSDSYNGLCGSWGDMFNLRVGFYGDYIFNRKLQNKSANNKATIHQTRIMTNAGLIALNFYDMFDVFATLGTSRIEQISGQEAYLVDTQEPNVLSYLQSDTDFSWSIGGRITAWECGCFSVGAEGQYFRTKPRITSIRSEGEVPDYSVRFNNITYSDWQLALGATYRINIVSCNTAVLPYTAIRWGQASFSTNDTTDFAGVIRYFDQEQDQSWGWAFGLTLVGCDRWSVTAEGRWASETAFHINTQVRF